MSARDDERLYHEQGVTLPETPPPSTDPPPWRETLTVGKRRSRVDGYERLSGAAIYPSDMQLPGMLHAAFLRCPHPHAKLTSLDTRAARALPGVHAVIDDTTPEAAIDWNYQGGEGGRLFAGHCRFEGAPVAAVAAETPHIAREAVEAIVAEWEVLPHVSDARDADAEDAPRIRDGGNRIGEPSIYTRGDVAQGFAEADAVVERDFHTACELHTPLELHGCVAAWDGLDLTIWESTQGCFRVQEQVAGYLDLPLSRVRVVGHYMGGGFGSKLETGKYAVVAALLARRTGRPVKLVLTREETMLVCGNRPANSMHMKVGVRKDGTLTAIELTGRGSGGFWRGGTGLVDWLAKDLYACPNVRTELTSWATNAGNQRPFRAPGHPQGSWALEQVLDELAGTIGIDPVELRLRNVPGESQARGGVPYSSTGLAECLRDGAREFGWEEARRRTRESREAWLARGGNGGAPHRLRGVGVGGCVWVAGGGGPPATVLVRMYADGSVTLNMGAADIGTGTRTVMASIVAEELGVRLETIQVENADTGTTAFSGPSGGSKTVPTDGPATRDATVALKQQLLAWASEQLDTPRENLRYAGEFIEVRGRDQRLKVTDVERLQRRRSVVGVGHRGPNQEGLAICPFAAHFCEVEVDTLTGEVRVLRFLGAQDSGRVMSRKTFDSQVYGGIAMGIGFGLTEERVLDRGQTGKLCNKSWHDYKLPTAMDVPADLVSLPIELQDDRCNNIGAKGLGEPVTIPTASAIANAIHDACGVWIDDTPASPPRVLAALRRQRDRKEARR
ncbi:molybdopterin-dependent oxidoreductase [bacterium]|nr:molybdopterin-dependent oxidoreductase [bacterium]